MQVLDSFTFSAQYSTLSGSRSVKKCGIFVHNFDQIGNIMNLEPGIAEKAQYWQSAEVFDPKTRNEIADLLTNKDNTELVDRFYKDLEFGTGGLRGIIGAGTSRMNVYNIRKASQALASYLIKTHPEKDKNTELRVAISYDSRNFSDSFSKAAAEVLAANNITVYLTKEMRPVPMLSFMVRHYNCQAGICITASHNPPAYNGFKVYWETGGQLVPPHDKNIIKEYATIADYSQIPVTPFDKAVESGCVKLVLEDLEQAYYKNLSELSLLKGKVEDIRIVYSPIHGTGVFAVPRALKNLGFNDVNLVEEQKKPDGNFPTVSSPNPEDAEAMSMAKKLGEKNDADLVMGTDPDTDRIGILVKEDGKLISYNGNQLGCLLNYFVLSKLKEDGRIPENPLVVKTIVTTELQRKIAIGFGVDIEDTLTGFKWICDLIEGYENGSITPKKNFICGGEESYGFLAGTFVRDKDAVIGCSFAAEMVSYYKSKGKSLKDVLFEIFAKFGVYYELLHTETLPGKAGKERMDEMMLKLRQNPPFEVSGIKVLEVHDIQTSEIKSYAKGSWKVRGELKLPSSNVLQFFLEDGSKVSVRPSGTEPKIKFYTSVNKSVGEDLNKILATFSDLQDYCKKIEQSFVEVVTSL